MPKRKKLRPSNGQPEDGRKRKEIAKESEAFEQFYKEQKMIPEEEFETFISKLREPLPLTFRITQSRKARFAIRDKIEKDFLKLFEAAAADAQEGEVAVAPPQPLPWSKERFAWEVRADKTTIRKHPLLRSFQDFLVVETDMGNITRQEAVSMLPVLFLDVNSSHRVLDMCAAPGSKTTQLLEDLHGDRIDASPDGFVVANEQNLDRAFLLAHQSKRLRSPSYVVVNGSGQLFPRLKNAQGERIRFDRVLADVPCSGDGTLRKSPISWKKWSAQAAITLHRVQVPIALRGAKLLSVGGRMVYSTCSFNPLENEAVVAEVLRRCKGGVRLVDVRSAVPELVSRPGMTKWKVLLKTGQWLEREEDKPSSFQSVVKSLFPPTEEEVAQFNLHYCIRVMPHDQNTGGFFVAAFEKTAEFSLDIKEGEMLGEEDDVVDTTKSNRQLERERKEAIANVETKAKAEAGADVVAAGREAGVGDDDGAEGSGGSQKRKRSDGADSGGEEEERTTKRAKTGKDGKKEHIKEAPYRAIDMDKYADKIASISETYGLPKDFPWQLCLNRSEHKMTRLSMVSASVLEVMVNNPELSTVNAGVRAFAWIESADQDTCNFRICQEGVPLVEPYMTKQVIELDANEIPKFFEEKDSTGNIPLSALSEEAQKALSTIRNGSYVIKVKPVGEAYGKEDFVVLCGWKGATNTTLYITKAEQSSVLAELFGADYNRRK